MDLAAIDTVARWAHIVGIVVWMGHNYANVIQNPVFVPVETGDPEGSFQARVDAAMKREHAIFRHASLVTLISGLFMLWYRDILVEAVTLSGGYAALGVGAWIGTLMVLNLWLVLWPHQKKVLGFVEAPVAERIRCSRVTFLSSRTNTILSFPAIFFMASGAHGGALFG
jgi:uncharacterized membrane protein